LPAAPTLSTPPSSSRGPASHQKSPTAPISNHSNPSVFPSPHVKHPASAVGHGLRARNTTRMRSSGGALKSHDSDEGGSHNSARQQQQVLSSSGNQ
jgi:hypothetical protein